MIGNERSEPRKADSGRAGDSPCDQAGGFAAGSAGRPPVGNRGESLARSVVANWLGYVVVVVTGFVLPRLIDVHRGKEALGFWDFGWGLVSYINLLSLGVGSAVNRHVARFRTLGDWDALNAMATSSLAVLTGSFVLGVAAVCAFAGLVPVLLPEATPEGVLAARWLVILLGAAATLKLPFAVFNGVITGHQRFDVLNLIRGLRDIFVLAAMFTLLLTGKGIVTLGVAVLAGEFLADLAKVVAARRICPPLRFAVRHAGWREAREMVAFGGKTVVQGLARGGLYQANSILVAYFLGPAALAVYSRQRVLVMNGLRFLKTYSNVFVPRSGSLHASGDLSGLRELLITGSRFGFHLTLPIIAVLLIMGGPLLEVWMGADYRAPLVLAILAVGHVLSLPQQSAYSILMGMGRHGLPSAVELVAAVVSLVLGILAIGPFGWGMIGAAVAVALPVTFSGGLMPAWYACRLLGLPLWGYVRAVLPRPFAAVMPFAACLLAAKLWFHATPWLALLVGLAVGGAVLVGVYWVWVLPAHLRKRVARMLGKGRPVEAVRAAAEPGGAALTRPGRGSSPQ